MEQEIKKNRKPRHGRSEGARYITHYITKNDIEVLTLLARYKYLRSTFIKLLLPHRKGGLGHSLGRLHNIGYLEKPPEQLRGYNNLYCPDIYSLSELGEKVLLERGISPLAVTRLYRKETDAPIKNFAHAMMICDTLASIEIGCIKDGVRFIPWTEIVARTEHTNPLKLEFTIAHAFKNGTERLNGALIPDGFFGVETSAGVSFFALEAENWQPISRENLKSGSFLKKFLAYRDIIKRADYKAQLGVTNMRVLVVAPTKTRVTHMLELGASIVPQSNLFLFYPVPVQEVLFKAPKPFPNIFKAPLKRVGLEATTLSPSGMV